MGSLFKSPKPPAPDPELKAAQEKQEAMLEQQEKEKKMQIAAKTKAQKYGGYRLLLSKERPLAETGIKTTLGPSS